MVICKRRNYMTNQEALEKFKSRLLKEQEKITVGLAQRSRQTLDFHWRYKKDHQLPSVNKALSRLAHSVYGICLECQNKISILRLTLEPTASRCVRCQKKFEKQNK